MRGIEHRVPTDATVKLLYAHAIACAYPDCPEPLYREDELAGTWTLNSRVCHICARREGGPRWESSQSEGDNRSEGNLVLMCLKHASWIDEPGSLETYPTTLLRTWKQAQVADHRSRNGGWPLTTSMANAAIEASFTNVGIGISNSTLSLGGEGGRAAGAGGGGGGAIGPGARAGDGGAGGEIVSGSFDLATLMEAGLDRIEVVIGEGGKGTSLPGQHGADGAQSALTARSKDGEILGVVRARGGFGGRSGAASLPDGVSEVAPSDLENGFRITTLMPVNSAEFHDGLLFLLGGEWRYFPVPGIPHQAVWAVACTAVWDTLEDAPRGITLALIDPSGREAACQSLVVSADAFSLGLISWVAQLGATFDAVGPWKLQVCAGATVLAERDVEVRLSES